MLAAKLCHKPLSNLAQFGVGVSKEACSVVTTGPFCGRALDCRILKRHRECDQVERSDKACVLEHEERPNPADEQLGLPTAWRRVYGRIPSGTEQSTQIRLFKGVVFTQHGDRALVRRSCLGRGEQDVLVPQSE